MTFVQELRKGVAGIDRQRREHRKNFLLKIAMRPGCAFRTKLSHLGDPDAVFSQLREQLLVPECILRRHQLAHYALDVVEGVGWAQSVRGEIARFALDLLLDSSDPNLEELIQVRTENRKELDALNEGLGWILCFLKHAAIEFQPTQLAIDKIPGIGKTIRCRNIPRKDRDVGGRLVNDSSSGNSCRHLLSFRFCGR